MPCPIFKNLPSVLAVCYLFMVGVMVGAQNHAASRFDILFDLLLLFLKGGAMSQLNRNIAPLILRVVVGLLLLAHGIPKIFDPVPFIGYVAQITGEPLNWVAAIATIAVELVGGLLLVIGVGLRPVALIAGVWFLGIAFVVHGSDFLLIFNLIGDSQTRFEYPFLIAISSLAIALWTNRDN